MAPAAHPAKWQRHTGYPQTAAIAFAITVKRGNMVTCAWHNSSIPA
jgi:hypothetical protein